MKNKKLGFISLISVLSIGGVAFAAVASTQNSYLSEVEAEETSPCTVRLLSTNAPTLQNGSGTGLSGTVEFKYSNASVEANSHVKLGYLGSVQTSGLAWDGTKGGVINGIRSISVEFEKDKVMYNDPYGWSKIPASSLKLISIYQDGATSQDSLDKSGKTMTFKETNLPTGFKIELQKDYDYEGDTSGLFAKIKSVTIQADMIVRNRIKLTEHGHRCKLWYSNANHENLGSISNLSYNNFIAGSVIGFTLDPEYGETMKLDGITYSGGSLVEEVVEGQLCPNYYFTLAEGQVGQIEIVTAGRPELYPGRTFVGTYTAVNADLSNLKAEKVEILSDGRLIWGSNKWTYTADEADNLTIKDQPNNKKRELSFINEDLIRLSETYTSGSQAPEYVYALRGNPEDMSITTITKVNNNKVNHMYNLTKGNVTYTVLTYYRTTIVNGINGIQIIPLDTTSISSAKLFEIRETLPVGSTFETDKNLVTYHEIHGQNEVACSRVKISNTSSGISRIEYDEYKGTYTGPKGELILDGYGEALLGNEPAAKYTLQENIVTIGDQKFDLDKSNNTYTIHVDKAADPWANASKTYAIPKYGTLTLNNGKATIAIDGYSSNPVDYKIANNVVSFEVSYDISSMEGVGTGTSSFEFIIGQDATTLKSTKKVETILWLEFDDEFPTGGFTVVAKDQVLALAQ